MRLGELLRTEFGWSMIFLEVFWVVVALTLALIDLELTDPISRLKLLSSCLSADVPFTYLLFFRFSIGVGLGVISSDSLLSFPSSMISSSLMASWIIIALSIGFEVACYISPLYFLMWEKSCTPLGEFPFLSGLLGRELKLLSALVLIFAIYKLLLF